MVMRKVARRWTARGVVIGMGLAVAAPVLAEDAALRPSKPWTVDYGDNECSLLREFGDGKKVIFFKLSRGFSLGRDTLIISGTNSMLRADRNAFSLRLAPDGKPIAQNGI
ncbi:MAG: hypothetical protein RLZZ58_1059, partial [Pseudomonadota bacterium]